MSGIPDVRTAPGLQGWNVALHHGNLLRLKKDLSMNCPMRIPKCVVLATVAVLSTVGSLQAQRPDSDLQAKARDEVRRKLAEIDGQQPPSTPAPAVPATPVLAQTQPVPPPPAAPVTTPPAAPVMATPATPATSQGYAVPAPNPGRAKAEEMLRQKMAELDAQEQENKILSGAAARGNAKPAPAQPVRLLTPAPTPQPKPMPFATPATQPKIVPMDTVGGGAPGPTSQPKAISVPIAYTPPAEQPHPVLSAAEASKQQRLDELLRLYKVDQITPQEYHVQRAKILSGP
jgi:hypothetical protein